MFKALASTSVLLIFTISPILSQEQNGFPYSYTKQDNYIVTIGTGIGLASLLFDTDSPITLTEIEQLNRTSINAFDRGATYQWSPRIDQYSDYAIIATTIAPLLVNYPEFFYAKNFEQNLILSLMYGESLLITYNLASFTKSAFKRNRPFMYNSGLTPQERLTISETENYNNAFFSRHTAFAFCSATYLSTIYSDIHGNTMASKIIWGTSLVGATSVGILRYQSGQHFPTDIIAGAIIGGFTGFLIPWVHRKKNTTAQIMVTPQGFQFSYRF